MAGEDLIKPQNIAISLSAEPSTDQQLYDEVVRGVKLNNFYNLMKHRLITNFDGATSYIIVASFIAFLSYCWIFSAIQASILCSCTAILVVLRRRLSSERIRDAFCIDHYEFEPPQSWRISKDDVIKIMHNNPNCTKESRDFMSRLLEKADIGDSTAWPPCVVKTLKTGKMWTHTMADARHEADVTLTTVFQGLLDKTGLKPHDIDMLVITCSIFSPTPTLCAMLCNKFKLRSDIITYNIAGTGCSANGVGTDLAIRLLQTPKDSNCVVIALECMTLGVYEGNERAFLVGNAIFRCGAAAVLLTNKQDKRAKYKLIEMVRHQDPGDAEYDCVYEDEDDNGCHGVRIDKTLADIASKTMVQNFRRLVRYITPSVYIDKIIGIDGNAPNLKNLFQHFAIHTRGRKILDRVQSNLNLSDRDMLPSRLTLYHYGNTIASSIW